MFVCMHLCACNNGTFFSGPNNKPKRRSSYYREVNTVYTSDVGLPDSNQMPTVTVALAEV